jgi:peptide deformylase
MLLPIVHFDTPVLRRKGARVTVFDSALRQFAADMIESMHAAEGIGLAAQQVGQALQLTVIDLRETDLDYSWELDGRKPPRELFMPLVLVNPVVTALPDRETVLEEGCLSFPEIRGDVRRPHAVRVEFQDLEGGSHQLLCDGLFARCVQHEVDHLQGVLFIDRMAKATLRELEPALKKLKRETRALARL